MVLVAPYGNQLDLIDFVCINTPYSVQRNVFLSKQVCLKYVR